MTYKYHPASMHFPMMEKGEMDGLRASIREHGYRSCFPIVTYQGFILDGRNRHEAAKAEGAEAVYAEYDGNDPYSFALAANAHRRHLPIRIRMQIVERMLPHIREEAKARGAAGRKGGKIAPPKKTGEAVAGILDVSERTADAAVKVLEHGSDELKDAMKNGEVSISKAAGIAELPKKEQPKAVTQAKQPKPPKVGKPVPNHDKNVSELFGKLIQAIDAQARYYGCVTKHGKVEETPAHAALRTARKEWEAWSKGKAKV